MGAHMFLWVHGQGSQGYRSAKINYPWQIVVYVSYCGAHLRRHFRCHHRGVDGFVVVWCRTVNVGLCDLCSEHLVCADWLLGLLQFLNICSHLSLLNCLFFFLEFFLRSLCPSTSPHGWCSPPTCLHTCVLVCLSHYTALAALELSM